MRTHKLGSAFLPSLALTLAAGLLNAGSASAYVLLSPARTWDCTPDYIVDNRAGGIPSITDADGGETRIVNAVVSATDAWNSAGAGKIIKAHKGSIAGFTLGDNIPMLNLTDPLTACTSPCLAATFTAYYSSRGAGSTRINDADIVTNAAAFNWTSQGEDPGGVGCSGEIYVEGVMVHEIGHALGLDHSAVAGATMAATVAACNNGPATTETDDESGMVALYGSSPCAACDTNTNYINAAGVSQYQPCGNYYSGGAGLQNGYLRGPAGSDFDLYLYKWNGSAWAVVASAATASTSENVSYNGTAGFYLWEVYSYSGTGTYHFYSSHP